MSGPQIMACQFNLGHLIFFVVFVMLGFGLGHFANFVTSTNFNILKVLLCLNFGLVGVFVSTFHNPICGPVSPMEATNG